MRYICSNTFRKSITFIMMFLLTAVCCVSFDASYDSFSSGGSIKGISQATVSHSLTIFAHTGVNKNKTTGSSEQNLDNTPVSNHILTRFIKKLMQIIGGSLLTGSAVSFSLYLVTACISGCVCLFCLTLVSFIHLKDGSK